MNKALAQEIKRQMAEIGIKVNLPAPVDQATIINQAIGNQVDSFLWRNYAGGDPDTLYPWFKSGSPVNFNKIDDPKVDAALAAGRAEPDEAKRTAIYEGLNRRLSSAGLQPLHVVRELVRRRAEQREGDPGSEPSQRGRQARQAEARGRARRLAPGAGALARPLDAPGLRPRCDETVRSRDVVGRGSTGCVNRRGAHRASRR